MRQKRTRSAVQQAIAASKKGKRESFTRTLFFRIILQVIGIAAIVGIVAKFIHHIKVH